MTAQPLDCVVSLSIGEALTFPGQLLHGGAALASGVRYVLVGFGNRKTGSTSKADIVGVGETYDYPADVSTGAAYRVVEGTARGPRIVALPASPHSVAVQAEQQHHLGISVAWDGCPEQHAFELKS